MNNTFKKQLRHHGATRLPTINQWICEFCALQMSAVSVPNSVQSPDFNETKVHRKLPPRESPHFLSTGPVDSRVWNCDQIFHSFSRRAPKFTVALKNQPHLCCLLWLMHTILSEILGRGPREPASWQACVRRAEDEGGRRRKRPWPVGDCTSFWCFCFFLIYVQICALCTLWYIQTYTDLLNICVYIRSF